MIYHPTFIVWYFAKLKNSLNIAIVFLCLMGLSSFMFCFVNQRCNGFMREG